LLQSRNQYDAAISSYKEAIICAPENTDFVFTFAKLYENLSQYCNSYNLFREFLKNKMKRKDSQNPSLTDYMEKYSNGIAKQYACN
jgi:tetratricopeptide (TPR) repeat protein